MQSMNNAPSAPDHNPNRNRNRNRRLLSAFCILHFAFSIGSAAFAQTVTCQVLHSPTGGDDATSPAHQPWSVTADDAGNISTTWSVPLDDDEGGVTLQLTEFGQSSDATALATFTDASHDVDSTTTLN